MINITGTKDAVMDSRGSEDAPLSGVEEGLRRWSSGGLKESSVTCLRMKLFISLRDLYPFGDQ